jgi:hypothetical protein
VGKKMTLLDTLNYFIEDQEGHLQCLEWDIREELNQEKPDIDWYCEEYDIAKQRVENLQEIKLMIEEKDPVKQILNDPNDELDRLIARIPTEGAIAMAEPIRKALEALPND